MKKINKRMKKMHKHLRKIAKYCYNKGFCPTQIHSIQKDLHDLAFVIDTNT